MLKRSKSAFCNPQKRIISSPSLFPNSPAWEFLVTGWLEQILHITGCHPFLIQAVCSSLIDNLHADNRERAELADVTEVMNQVLEELVGHLFSGPLGALQQEPAGMPRLSQGEIGEGDKHTKLHNKAAWTKERLSELCKRCSRGI